ncbi:uncharacterized protein LOC135432531 [Drosophila montana]|uniref:uncharacterized protein LOC135432531 n=1 Tax=Drosophila montana TaxID=40370 RepID=UPI00313DEA4C
MANGLFSKTFLQPFAIGVLLLCLTQSRAQESATVATTTSPDELADLGEQSTITAIPETTTEVGMTVDIVPATETENRNAGFDLSAAIEAESKDAVHLSEQELFLKNALCETDKVGFEIVTG